MKFLIDMNLPPSWALLFEKSGFEAVHWSKVGIDTAQDAQIMAWAKERGLIVFTHDLDFGKLLALTEASGPSVIQIRSPHVLPRISGEAVVTAIRQFRTELEAGALITVDSQPFPSKSTPH